MIMVVVVIADAGRDHAAIKKPPHRRLGLRSHLWQVSDAISTGSILLRPDYFGWVINKRAAIRAATLIELLVWHFAAHAHDQSRPELNSCFESLKSGKGPCCSHADGTALSDIDWEVRNGHYRVRIQGEWWDVPDEAVIKEPNRAGRTMVWPHYSWALDKLLRVDILCFMPGAMI